MVLRRRSISIFSMGPCFCFGGVLWRAICRSSWFVQHHVVGVVGEVATTYNCFFALCSRTHQDSTSVTTSGSKR